jgi:hypothetical protein
MMRDAEEAERKIMRILEKIQEEIEGSLVKKDQLWDWMRDLSEALDEELRRSLSDCCRVEDIYTDGFTIDCCSLLTIEVRLDYRSVSCAEIRGFRIR